MPAYNLDLIAQAMAIFAKLLMRVVKQLPEYKVGELGSSLTHSEEPPAQRVKGISHCLMAPSTKRSSLESPLVTNRSSSNTLDVWEPSQELMSTLAMNTPSTHLIETQESSEKKGKYIWSVGSISLSKTVFRSFKFGDLINWNQLSAVTVAIHCLI